jgi:hypothetical protein
VSRPDVVIDGEWGLYTCTPLTPAARTFVEEQVAVPDWESPARFHIEGGDRCRALVAGMVASGLHVTVNGTDMDGFTYAG